MSRQRPNAWVAALGVLVACPAVAQAPTPATDRAAAQAAFEAGDLAEARSILERLLTVTPNDPDLLRRLAAAEAAQGHLAEAMITIDRAKSLAPADPDILLARANILLWRGRIASARAQAAELAGQYSDYPGLADFSSAASAAEDANRLRLQLASIGQTVSRASFASGGENTWTVQQGALAIGWNQSDRATLEIDREDRTLVDSRVSARLDLSSGRDRWFVSASVTPDADFRETWSLGAGGEFRLADETDLLATVRYADYRVDDVTIVRLGIRQQLSRSISLTGETIQLFGGGADYRVGGSLRADYIPATGPSFFAIAASYPDAEADGTRQLRAVALGTGIPLGNGFTLRLAGEYENRRSSYERCSVNLGISWSFGS